MIAYKFSCVCVDRVRGFYIPVLSSLFSYYDNDSHYVDDYF